MAGVRNDTLNYNNWTLGMDPFMWNNSAFSMNGSNNSDSFAFWKGGENAFDQLYIKAIFITLYSIVFGFCFFGNLLVIFTVLMHRKMRTVTNFFLANLAVADLCVGVFCILPGITLYVSRDWKLGRVMCKLYYCVQAMSYAASIIILTVISIERYFAILHPFRCKMLTTIFLLRVVVLLIWVIAAGCGVPFLIFYDQVKVPSPGSMAPTYFCVNNWLRYYDERAYVVVNLVLWYIVPLLLMTLMYTRISIVLWRSSRTDSNMLSTGGTPNKDRSFKITFKKRFKRHTDGSSSNEDTYCTRIEDTKRSGATKGGATKCGATKSGCLGYTTSRCLRDFVREEDEVSNAGDSSDSNNYKLSLATKCETEEEVMSTLSANDISDIDDINAESKNLATKSEQQPVALRSKDSKKTPLIRKALSNGIASFTSNGRGTGTATKHQANNRRLLTRNMAPRSVRFSEMARQERGENALLARRRVIRLLVAIIVAFALCVLPNHIRLLWEKVAGYHSHSQWYFLIPPIAHLIFYLNSALNPVLYAFLSDNFRKSLRELFGRFMPAPKDKAHNQLARKNNYSLKTNQTVL